MDQKSEAIKALNKGGIVVIPTDTIYGISARALDEKAVRKVHELKDRNNQKPFIILINSIKDLEIFGIKPDSFAIEVMKKYWLAFAEATASKPFPVSIIFDCPDEKFSYLHLGTKTLAFRIPAKKDLLEIIKETGPLISTSANHPGEKLATMIDEAKKYFGNEIDLYVDEGELNSSPSTLIKIENEKIIVIRQGAIMI